MPTKKPAGGSSWVDPDDAPELTEEWFATAEIRKGDRVVRPGRWRSSEPGQEAALPLDPDLLDRLRATGPGWQARLNEAVREWLERHAPA